MFTRTLFWKCYVCLNKLTIGSRIISPFLGSMKPVTSTYVAMSASYDVCTRMRVACHYVIWSVRHPTSITSLALYSPMLEAFVTTFGALQLARSTSVSCW